MIFRMFFKMAVVTVLCVLVYAAAQQTYRSNANDPQIQIGEDIRSRLEEGRTLEKGLPGDSTDLSKSLGVFTVLYDARHQAICSTGFLDGGPPQPPSGVFDFARTHGENRVSWQPRSGVRIALVIFSVQSLQVGFVAVGRSLREVELRENNLLHMVFFGWVICMGILVVSGFFPFRKK